MTLPSSAGGQSGRALRVLVRQVTDDMRRRADRPRSIRVTIAFDERGLRAIDRTRRVKPAPPSEPLDRPPRPDAIVAELRRRDGGVVYRRRLVRPIPQDVEVFDPEAGPRRIDAPPRHGSFSVVVPATSGVELVIDAGPDVRLAQFGAGRADAVTGRRVLGRFRTRE